MITILFHCMPLECRGCAIPEVVTTVTHIVT